MELEFEEVRIASATLASFTWHDERAEGIFLENRAIRCSSKSASQLANQSARLGYESKWLFPSLWTPRPAVSRLAGSSWLPPPVLGFPECT